MGVRVDREVPADLDGERLDRVLAVLAGISRASSGRLLDEGVVTLDGVTESGRTRVRAGQSISYLEPDDDIGVTADPAVEFEVVLEDSHVIVVDKPVGLTVHPGAGRPDGTLVNGLLARYPELEGVGQEGRWGIVHRLDRETSGLLVVARTHEGYEGLSNQVRKRLMRREYLALVDGEFEAPTGSIEAPIARDPGRPTRRKAAADGKPAVTHFTVEQFYERDELSLVRARLETGRTHQIRVHFSAIGHPLVGDRLYRTGPDKISVSRLFLHATRLGFEHPVTAEPVECTSALPSELAGTVEQLR